MPEYWYGPGDSTVVVFFWFENGTGMALDYSDRHDIATPKVTSIADLRAWGYERRDEAPWWYENSEELNRITTETSEKL